MARRQSTLVKIGGFVAHRNQIAHQRLNSWASWIAHFEDSSALGAKIVNYNASRSGGVPTSIVPNVFRDPEIVLTERAVEEQTPTVRRHINAYYILDPKDPKYFKLTRRQVSYMLQKVADYLMLK